MTPREQKTPNVRVRIAPSPTGLMHIGTARTALFNLLFARKHSGVFVLRIEDTDRERSTKEFEKNIIDGLSWLGLRWDEGPDMQGSSGPYRQSERGAIYARYIEKLLHDGRAYHCFCTGEELEAERQAMLALGQAPKYSGRCKNLSGAEAKEHLAHNRGSVIRFRMPEEKITVDDIVRGKTVFDMALVGDIVIAKSPSAPLFNFAVVVDDYEMNISHVIRGEEHFTNTPKQIAIGEALGFPRPKFAHIPLILNPDRSKMSKRHGATSVEEYRGAGYLPDALVNFLALIGWHPLPEVDRESGKVVEREIFSIEELVSRFELERVQKAGAVFNADKLDWINAQYVKRLTSDEFLSALRSINAVPPEADAERVARVLPIVRDRIKKLTDFVDLASFFFSRKEYPRAMLLWKDVGTEQTRETLRAIQKELSTVNQNAFKKETLEPILNSLAKIRGRGETFWPIRIALSGREASPPPVEIMEAFGKEETLERVAIAIEKLSGNA